MPYDIFSEIRKERIKQGMSQKELGELVGVPQQTINRIEHGLRKLDMGLFEEICGALCVSPSHLMGWEASEPTTLAAHFDGDEYTESELNEIMQFAEFVKSKRKEK